MNIINIADLKDPDDPQGRSCREVNTEKKHKIPIGNLVEAKWDSWFGDGACWKVHARLWVVSHDRDCDGTPLYSLSRWNDPDFAKQVRQTHNGFSEESLMPIEITKELRDGYDSLSWREESV